MIKTIFIFFIFFLTQSVNASISITTFNNVEVEQEVIYYTNSSIDIKITIPKDYSNKVITINTNIFETIHHFGLLNKNNKEIKVNLIIVNNSNYLYSYKKDSLIIYPSFSRKQYLYRSNNSAIKKLFNNEKVLLDDKSITKKLKKLGYKNINDLDKYYLNYYNKKYKTKYKSINQFNNKIKKELFKKTQSKILETNSNIIELSYDYYYSKILKVRINNTIYTIEDCINYYINDSEFIYYFNNIRNNIVSFDVLLDKDYNDNFENYLSGSIKFTLEKN